MQWLAEAEGEETVNRLRGYTHTGRPCGLPTFVDQLENTLQRALRPNKRGRKPKPKQDQATSGMKGI